MVDIVKPDLRHRLAQRLELGQANPDLYTDDEKLLAEAYSALLPEGTTFYLETQIVGTVTYPWSSEANYFQQERTVFHTPWRKSGDTR